MKIKLEIGQKTKQINKFKKVLQVTYLKNNFKNKRDLGFERQGIGD